MVGGLLGRLKKLWLNSWRRASREPPKPSATTTGQLNQRFGSITSPQALNRGISQTFSLFTGQLVR